MVMRPAHPSSGKRVIPSEARRRPMPTRDSISFTKMAASSKPHAGRMCGASSTIWNKRTLPRWHGRRCSGYGIEWLAVAYKEGNPDLIELSTEPVFDPIRGDPRFSDLMRHVSWDV